MNLGLKGKVVLISGGSEGIGGGCSRVFAEEGANLVINYFVDDDQGPNFAKELADTNGIIAIAVRGDIGKEDDVALVFKNALDTLGQIDILVNNAAKGSIQKPFHTLTTREWRSVQEITLNGVFFMSRAFIGYCMENERGWAYLQHGFQVRIHHKRLQQYLLYLG